MILIENERQNEDDNREQMTSYARQNNETHFTELNLNTKCQNIMKTESNTDLNPCLTEIQQMQTSPLRNVLKFYNSKKKTFVNLNNEHAMKQDQILNQETTLNVMLRG